MASSTFFESLVWLDFGLNPGILDHWWTLYSLGYWTKFTHQRWIIFKTIDKWTNTKMIANHIYLNNMLKLFSQKMFKKCNKMFLLNSLFFLEEKNSNFYIALLFNSISSCCSSIHNPILWGVSQVPLIRKILRENRITTMLFLIWVQFVYGFWALLIHFLILEPVHVFICICNPLL